MPDNWQEHKATVNDVETTVRMRRVDEPEDVNTVGGTVRVNSGDYVVERPESARGVHDTLTAKQYEDSEWSTGAQVDEPVAVNAPEDDRVGAVSSVPASETDTGSTTTTAQGA